MKSKKETRKRHLNMTVPISKLQKPEKLRSLRILFFGSNILVCALMIGLSVYLGWYALNQTINVADVDKDVFFLRIAHFLFLVTTSMFLVGFCGCCGASEDHKRMLWIYLFFVGAFIFFQLIISIEVSVSYADTQIYALESFKTRNGTNSTLATAFFGKVQDIFQCCGYKGIEDWLNVGVNDPPRPCAKTGNTVGCVEAIAPYQASLWFLLLFIFLMETILAVSAGFLGHQEVLVEEVYVRAS